MVFLPGHIHKKDISMDENEVVTEIHLSDEQISDMDKGTVEIASGSVSGQKPKKKKGAPKFLLGFLAGFATMLVILLVTFIICFGIIKRANPNSLINSQVIYKADLLNTILKVFYYEDVSDEDVVEGIYSGIIKSTGDKYSEYYPAEDMDMVNSNWEGKFYGIGAVLTIDPDSSYTKIESVELDSPAEKAGVMAGDYIEKVDGENVVGMDLTDVVSRVRGENNTDVVLTVIRGGRRYDITVTRGEITTTAVAYEMEDDNIAYIQIGKFSDVAEPQFEEAIKNAKADGAKGLIFDLRGNPGGGLDTAVAMCNQFMPAGLIVYTEDKNQNRKEYFSDGKNEWDIPIVVLVNGNSASASEIMTGAIKDTGIGTIVGTTTYGKGVYQNVIPLPDGSSVKITAGRFFSPAGTCFHGVGIEPDVEVELDVDAYLDEGIDTQYDKAVEVLKEKMNSK